MSSKFTDSMTSYFIVSVCPTCHGLTFIKQFASEHYCRLEMARLKAIGYLGHEHFRIMTAKDLAVIS